MTDKTDEMKDVGTEEPEPLPCTEVYPYCYPSTWEDEDGAQPEAARSKRDELKVSCRASKCEQLMAKALKDYARDIWALRRSSEFSRRAVEGVAIQRVLCSTSDTCCPDRGTAMRTARRFISAAAENRLYEDIDGALTFALILVKEDVQRAFGLEVWQP